MTLDVAPSGTPVRIAASDASRRLLQRPAVFGLRPGQTVTPLHRTVGGGRVLVVGDSRVAVAGAILRTLDVVVV